MSTRYILRFDDISPGMAWSKFLPLKHRLEKMGVKSVLGVIPECRDPSLFCEPAKEMFFDLVREWVEFGDSIAQHGTYHLYDSDKSGLLQINDRSEFAGHPYDMQLERLAHGKSILVQEKVWQPFFMAPSHSFDENTLKALKRLKFQAITDGYGVFPYRLNGIVLVPQLTSFPFNIGIGYCTICVHINTMSYQQIEYLLNFITLNRKRFACFQQTANLSQERTGYSHSLLRGVTKLILRSHRAIKNKIIVD